MQPSFVRRASNRVYRFQALVCALGPSLLVALGCAGQPDVASTPAGATPLTPASAPAVNATANPSALGASLASSSDPPASPSANPAPANSAAPALSASSAAGTPPPSLDEENVYAPGHAATTADVPLVDANGKPLPQTDARPSAKNATFEARMRLLARAVTSGDADAALPAFFPAVAYAQVKDIPQPDKDWEHRLVAAFRRDIAEYHGKLGPDAAKAVLVAVEVPENKATFMKPGSEGNRVGYYRVLRSTVTFKKPDGKEQSFELTSMISWRGEWYVVHLHGFK
ncbi:MAG TPA: hypothetical protein VLJ38_12740 [Polyangiaceae bacterium]|nr:hypothetical protein [Polyangiaceae bacterium]